MLSKEPEQPGAVAPPRSGEVALSSWGGPVVGTAAATTLPSVRSPCDIWWPNAVARVGHHLDRTFQVRDMETAWTTCLVLPVSAHCVHI